MPDKPKNKRNQGKGKQKGEEKTKIEPKEVKKQLPDNSIQKDHSETTDHVDTVALFANLKRETDEILAITETKNKYSKREIINNWTKYELPSEDLEENNGADFEELLQMPVSRGHFQFKHEKTWNSDSKINDFKSLFNLNLNYLSSGLLCIPSYKRNNLDPDLFSKEQLDLMNSAAERNMSKFKKNLPIEKLPAASANILKKLQEPSKDKEKTPLKDEMCEDDAIDDELEKMLVSNLADEQPENLDQKDSGSMFDITSDDLIISLAKNDETIVLSKVPQLPEKSSPVKQISANDDDDDELDEILGIKSIHLTTNDKEQRNSRLKTQPAKPVSTPLVEHSTPVEETKMDLDKWLDDYLDS